MSMAICGIGDKIPDVAVAYPGYAVSTGTES